MMKFIGAVAIDRCGFKLCTAVAVLLALAVPT